MVDALVSGASAARRVGSSPILGTPKGVFFGELLFVCPNRTRSVGGGVAYLPMVGDYCCRNLLSLSDNCL